MEYKKYGSLREVLGDITRKDQDYSLTRHTFKNGEGIKRHYHPRANEWLIIDNGKFEIRVDEVNHSFSIRNKFHAFKFLVAQKHAFRALSDITYYVLRDTEDETVFSNNIF